jgi:hypothetical protein
MAMGLRRLLSNRLPANAFHKPGLHLQQGGIAVTVMIGVNSGTGLLARRLALIC